MEIRKQNIYLATVSAGLTLFKTTSISCSKTTIRVRSARIVRNKTMTEMNTNQSFYAAECVIISDSWLNNKRIESLISENINKDKIMNIFPHESPTGYELKVKNLSKGSLAMSEVVCNHKLLGKWIENKPKITVLHTYACDVINKKNSIAPPLGVSVGTHYTNFMLAALDSMREFAMERLSKQEYQVWQKDHRFMIFALPDWKNFKQERPDSLDAVKYRALRSRINQTLKKKKGLFWRAQKALVIHPAMSQVEMIGVHLKPYFQSLYNNFLLRSVAKLVCVKCSLKPEATNEQLCTAANRTSCLNN